MMSSTTIHPSLNTLQDTGSMPTHKLSRHKDFGPIIGQEYLVNDEKQFMISKLNPYPLISRVTNSDFFSPYLNKTYLTSTITDTLRRENNAQTLSLGYYKSLGIYHINLSPNLELSHTLGFSK